MSAILWLIRHGETDWNREGRWQGWRDVPLNATGLAQAEAMAERLAGAGVAFGALYASPLRRALQTAQPTAHRLGLEIRIDERLREIHQGAFEGLTHAEIAQRFAAELEAIRRAPALASAPGGETVTQVAARVRAAADDIARRHGGQTVLVFGHGLALATLYCQANAIPLDEVARYIPTNGDILMVEWNASPPPATP